MKKLKSYSLKPSILDLPTPIITDILASLPTKSILSCKSVNKLWCSIIKDPLFRKSSKYFTMIVRHANKNMHLVEPEVNYTVRNENGNLCLVVGKEAVIRLNNDNGFDGIPVNTLKIVNSCKGLVCFNCFSSDYLATDHFVVWNPVMSDYVVVEHSISSKMRGDILHKYIGFGLSSKTDEYKVVRLFENLKKKDGGKCCLEAYVCTLGGDDEWRLLENRPPQGFRCVGMATYVEGALHWIIVDIETFVSGSIVVFDCEEETFALMDLPTVFIHIGWMPNELTTLRSQLCAYLYTWESACREHYDIWVMKEYGVKESWIKLFVVSSDTIDRLMPVKPLAYWNNGEIIMLSEYKELVSYDVTSNTWRAIKIPGIISEVEAIQLDPIFIPTKTLVMQGKQPKTKLTE